MRKIDYSKLTHRECSVCKQKKPVSEFNKYTDSKQPINGWRYYSRCRECNKELCSNYGKTNRSKRNKRLREWRRNNPDVAKLNDQKKRFKSKYGLTLEQVEFLKSYKDNRCWICNEITNLFVDHNHSSGRIRGMLCASCNTFLGRIEKHPKLLENMKGYLDQPCHADLLLEIANS